MPSRHLRIRVQEGGHIQADLTFEANMAARLGDLLPPGYDERMRARGLDVQQIAADAANREFAPGDLFQITEGSKQVRIWLE